VAGLQEITDDLVTTLSPEDDGDILVSTIAPEDEGATLATTMAPEDENADILMATLAPADPHADTLAPTLAPAEGDTDTLAPTAAPVDREADTLSPTTLDDTVAEADFFSCQYGGEWRQGGALHPSFTALSVSCPNWELGAPRALGGLKISIGKQR